MQEIDLSMRQNEGLSASIALNDIKYDASVRQAKKIKGITGGAALAGSESGTTVSTDHDHRVPKAPLGLVVQLMRISAATVSPTAWPPPCGPQ